MHRRFMMIRRADSSGVSGTGHVADGVQFEDGTVVIRWRVVVVGSSVFYSTLEDAVAVHGHGGDTIFHFVDSEDPANKNVGKQTGFCCMCFSTLDIGQTYCDQCGAGGADITISQGHAEAIQLHDKQRLEELEKRNKELQAFRRVAFDVFGPLALGLEPVRYVAAQEDSGIKAGDIMGAKYAGGTTIHCVNAKPGEDEREYLARAVEHVTFDPERIRRVAELSIVGDAIKAQYPGARR